MVLPAQFELGLELTNIVNPISQALSALGSLAVIDAINKSGSDFITETKLANLIGRHRIDPIIKFHFRELVCKSDQSMISRYLDIILEAGSGPTVQEALKNPALFSMVIQLSGLAFAHDDEYLANALVQAIENIVQESGGDLGIVPDYASLLGTLRACQQQTAAFRWALLYEAAEQRIHEAFASPDSHSRNERTTDDYIPLVGESDESVGFNESRTLPVPLLQGLLMWLRSLQSFPEHRLLHIRCGSGISTMVVWCHHILGLSVVMDLQTNEIRFGDAPYNIRLDYSVDQKGVVSLMDPLDPLEPLFTLQNDGQSIRSSYEHRAEAYGYGVKFLQFNGFPEYENKKFAQWVMSHSVEVCENFGTSDILYNVDAKPPILVQRLGLRYPSRIRLLTAGRFLFGLDQDTTASSSKHAIMLKEEAEEPGALLNALVIMVIAFARISEDDLARCKEIPLALNVSLELLAKELITTDLKEPNVFINLVESFEVLSLLLLGRRLYSDDYVRPAFLLSAWGWSVFLDSTDAVDPFDVSVETLRVLRGVPSRRGSRRTRIIDGPQQATMLDPYRIGVCLRRGVSTAEKGVILVGHHSDAFQVSQQFTCRSGSVATYMQGFRKMTEWSIKSRRLPPCRCYKSKGKSSSEAKLNIIDRLVEEKDGLVQRHALMDPNRSPMSERALDSKDYRRRFFYVSDNPAARWLQLEALNSTNGPWRDCYVGLRGQDTCIDCAIRNAELWLPNGLFLL